MDFNGMIKNMEKLQLLTAEIDNEMYRLAEKNHKTAEEIAQFKLLTHLKKIYNPEYFESLRRLK